MENKDMNINEKKLKEILQVLSNESRSDEYALMRISTKVSNNEFIVNKALKDIISLIQPKTTSTDIEETNIVASVSGGAWSYLTNQNGNSMRVTLEGHGSCTPANVLQEWVDKMSYEEKVKLSKRIDEANDIYD